MDKISIVTYLRSNECITDALNRLVDALSELQLLDDVFIFSANRNADIPIRWIVFEDEGRTKYSRLRELIQKRRHKILLSVDNDMNFNIDMIISFYEAFIESRASIGWGRIGVANKGFVPDMVHIDKILSHYYIRPLLWHCGIGISIPGQCFIIRSDEFVGILPDVDTYLDDLQIGLVTNLEKRFFFGSSILLGTEEAKENLYSMLMQRRRWARGYWAVLKLAMTVSWRAYFLVLFHGIMYHVCFPVILLLIVWVAIENPLWGVLLLALLLITITRGDVKLVFPFVTYSIIFPLLHFFWGGSIFLLIFEEREKNYSKHHEVK